MLARYSLQTRESYVHALREILQEVALLGLWRSKFFEHAAFYGGTALRILHGLDRYSEDLDFSLLKPNPDFSIRTYGNALQREVNSFGFTVPLESIPEKKSPIDSAFLKGNTYQQMIVIKAPPELLRSQHRDQILRVKIEIDRDPPPGFDTDTHYVLNPVPFPVRVYALSDLFAGKLHAVLCRKWGRRVKGRDWYDMVWYLANHPQAHLSHLEARMRQSGDYEEDKPMTAASLRQRLGHAIDTLDVGQARAEVAPFLRDPRAVEVWSKDFFRSIIDRIEPVETLPGKSCIPDTEPSD